MKFAVNSYSSRRILTSWIIGSMLNIFAPFLFKWFPLPSNALCPASAQSSAPLETSLMISACLAHFLLWVLSLFFFNSFIHMCIHCLSHFSPLPLAPSLYPRPLLTSRQNLFCPCL
jgi:hypothetical protein